MSDATLDFRGGTLVLEGPAAVRELATGPAVHWAWDRRIGAWRCDAVHYAAVADALQRAGAPWVDQERITVLSYTVRKL